jgi:WD40 repeat protein
VLTFRRPIGVLAATPDGTRFIVAATDVGASVWSVQTAQLVVGLEPAPAVILSAPEAPHVEVANAVTVAPDGRRVALALESRLLVYDIDSGRIVSARPYPHGIVRAVAWSPGGDALLVSSFYDPSARLIAVEDGREQRAFPVDREGAALAFSDDGRNIAVGSELGSIAIFDVATGTRLRRLSEARGATRGLVFVGTNLVGIGDDGVLRSWDLDRDAPSREIATQMASPMAREPGGLRIASAGRDGSVRIYDVAQETAVAELRWHAAPLSALAWVGTSIVSGDADGHVALWNAP